jgi:molybdopterin synthase catalytic subunit
VQVTVRCFAAARELLGSDHLVLADVVPGTTAGQLVALLAARAPDLARLRLAGAVNRAYATDERVLREGDEVALIPPISGGSDAGGGFAFTAAPIDRAGLERSARTDADGAVVTFLGVARDHHAGRRVVRLAYEAYEEMASEVVARILVDARTRFAVGQVRAVHRLGVVPVGEAAVAVCVAAPHRGPAFDACRHVMDRIKHEAPIFKREDYADGSAWVGEPPRPAPGEPPGDAGPPPATLAHPP